MRTGQEQDYVQYVKLRLPYLHRTAYLLCGDAHRADDIVQAALTTLYVSWKRARAADNVDAYVHQILVRRYLDERRRRWSTVLLSERLPEAPGAASAGYEEREELMTALRSLPEGQRAVVVLRYFNDLSVEATAEAVGCSTGNVKSQCARGLQALRRLLEPVTTEEGTRERR